MQNKLTLDTPCLVIDKIKLLANLETMQNEVNQLGKQLRPHIKTHKCTKLSKLQLEYGAIGLSAAKLGEAEVLVNAGLKGILITSPIVTPQKIERLSVCLKKDSSIMVVIDHPSNAGALNIMAEKAKTKLNVLVDINPGVGRTGISYQETLSLASFIHKLPYLQLRGIQCYAGNLQHITEYEQRKQQSSAALKKAAEVVKTLKENGLPCDIFTGSGTGTYDIDCQISEVTEVQPGSYTVMDMEYFLIESKNNKHLDKFRPALTLLTTVISANHKSHVTVDAGTKALYFDPNTKPKVISHPGLHYDWGGFGDEHGKIIADPGISLPQVGDILELIVPHCDPTINLFDKFYITEGDQVSDVWNIDMRGKVQ